MGVWRRARVGRLCGLLAVVVALAATLSAPAIAAEEGGAEKIVETAVDAYNEGDYEKAAALLADAAQRFPKNDRILYWLGMAYRQQEKWDDAYDTFRKHCDLRPGDAKARVRVAEVCERNGDQKGAVHWYEAALKLDPDNQELKDKLAKAKAGEVAAKPKKQGDAKEDKDGLLRHGVTSTVKGENRVWAHVGAAVLIFLVIPHIVRRLCVKGYRLPLTLGESQATGWIVLLVCVATCVLAWGYEPHWRMIVLGVLAGGEGLFAYAAAKAESIMAVKAVLDWMARR